MSSSLRHAPEKNGAETCKQIPKNVIAIIKRPKRQRPGLQSGSLETEKRKKKKSSKDDETIKTARVVSRSNESSVVQQESLRRNANQRQERRRKKNENSSANNNITSSGLHRVESRMEWHEATSSSFYFFGCIEEGASGFCILLRPSISRSANNSGPEKNTERSDGRNPSRRAPSATIKFNVFLRFRCAVRFAPRENQKFCSGPKGIVE
jgi:hypothetical protein